MEQLPSPATALLHEAVFNDDLPNVNKILNCSPANKKGNCLSQDLAGLTPVHISSVRGNFEITRFLLVHTPPQQVQELRTKLSLDEETVLHTAALSGNVELLQEVLSSQPWDVDAQDWMGHTALHNAARAPAACARRRTSTRAPTDDSDPLIYDGSVYVLLKEGASCNAQTKLGDTPLHYAAGAGNLPACTALLTGLPLPLLPSPPPRGGKPGADVNKSNAQGDTALHVAAAAGDGAVVQLLLAHGADSSARNNEGHTAADEADLAGYPHISSLLPQQQPHADADGKRDDNEEARHATDRPTVAPSHRHGSTAAAIAATANAAGDGALGALDRGPRRRAWLTGFEAWQHSVREGAAAAAAAAAVAASSSDWRLGAGAGTSLGDQDRSPHPPSEQHQGQGQGQGQEPSTGAQHGSAALLPTGLRCRCAQPTAARAVRRALAAAGAAAAAAVCLDVRVSEAAIAPHPLLIREIGPSHPLHRPIPTDAKYILLPNSPYLLPPLAFVPPFCACGHDGPSTAAHSSAATAGDCRSLCLLYRTASPSLRSLLAAQPPPPEHAPAAAAAAVAADAEHPTPHVWDDATATAKARLTVALSIADALLQIQHAYPSTFVCRVSSADIFLPRPGPSQTTSRPVLFLITPPPAVHIARGTPTPSATAAAADADADADVATIADADAATAAAAVLPCDPPSDVASPIVAPALSAAAAYAIPTLAALTAGASDSHASPPPPPAPPHTSPVHLPASGYVAPPPSPPSPSKANAFALGVVMLELLTGQPPVAPSSAYPRAWDTRSSLLYVAAHPLLPALVAAGPQQQGPDPSAAQPPPSPLLDTRLSWPLGIASELARVCTGLLAPHQHRWTIARAMAVLRRAQAEL